MFCIHVLLANIVGVPTVYQAIGSELGRKQ
jgi:hypothetical protein